MCQFCVRCFHALAEVSLTLNLAKCEFGQATITYLGKEVGQGQVRPVEAKGNCCYRISHSGYA